MPREDAVLQMPMCATGRTLKASCIFSGARKRKPVLRWMHLWNIAQRGGKQERHLPAQATTTLAGCKRLA